MSKWLYTLKRVVADGGPGNGDMRLGQYLYNVLRQDFIPSKDHMDSLHEDQSEHVAEKLWNVEAEELIKMIDDYEEKYSQQ